MKQIQGLYIFSQGRPRIIRQYTNQVARKQVFFSQQLLTYIYIYIQQVISLVLASQLLNPLRQISFFSGRRSRLFIQAQSLLINLFPLALELSIAQLSKVFSLQYRVIGNIIRLDQRVSSLIVRPLRAAVDRRIVYRLSSQSQLRLGLYLLLISQRRQTYIIRDYKRASVLISYIVVRLGRESKYVQLSSRW